MDDTCDLDADEVIITSSVNFVHVIDPKTGKDLKAYKYPKIAPKCLALLGVDFFIGAPSNIPDIKMWPVRDEVTTISSPCGIVNALAVTHNDKFCIAAFQKEIRVWDVQTGDMLARFTRHYQDITCLKFTNDDSLFLSGGKDGNVLVFNFESVCSVNADPECIKALYVWNNHSKEVTDIFLSEYSIWSRVATTSADTTCKIYELDTGMLLTTLCLDVQLTSVTMDPFGHHVILGTAKGCVLKVNFYDEQPREIHRNTSETEEVHAHVHAVTSLSCSALGNKFLSSALGESLFKIWDIASLTCGLVINCSDGPLSNAFFNQYPAPLLTNAEKYFEVSQLDRDFLSNPQERLRHGVNKTIKVHPRPLSLIHVSGIDEFYSPAVLSGKVHGPIMTASESVKTENLFQEAFRGETINDIREINAQMFTYMVDQIFKNMDPPAPKNPQIEEC